MAASIRAIDRHATKVRRGARRREALRAAEYRHLGRAIRWRAPGTRRQIQRDM